MVARIEGIEEREIRHMYEEKKMSKDDIGDYYGVSHQTILRRMKEYGIETRSLSESNRIYQINEDFFKLWTPESSWLYGWALGDGCFTNPLCLAFLLARKDREVLEKFKATLGSEHPIEDKAAWRDDVKKHYKSSRIRFYSKALVAGIKQLSYSDIPESYFGHFLRGFFEAEGSVFWNTYICSEIAQNDVEILDFILQCLHEFDIVKGGCPQPHRLSFSVNDTISLYHYMYDDCGNMFLKRKKERFEELIAKQRSEHGIRGKHKIKTDN